jgi:hypothetical protein
VSRLAARLELLPRWLSIARGRSYRHRNQEIGQSFVPDRLDGYFIDLTAKTSYPGPTDDDGLPLMQFRHQLIYHPTVVLQFGLGHWDRWLASGRLSHDHRARFLSVARWVETTIDERGGLSIWPAFGLEMASPYSAMTQGLAASLLLRVWSLDPDDAWLEHARRAMELMLLPVELGGTSRRIGSGIVLEEAPQATPNTVLNGWVFALYGLYDLALVDGPSTPRLGAALADTLGALAQLLPDFDVGWWSLYDTNGHLSSPFYHRLHVAQLGALERTFPAFSAQIAATRARWERALASRLYPARAVLLKAGQQLSNPPKRI